MVLDQTGLLDSFVLGLHVGRNDNQADVSSLLNSLPQGPLNIINRIPLISQLILLITQLHMQVSGGALKSSDQVS